MTQFEMLYLIGAALSFAVFAGTLAAARITSSTRPAGR